jgi:O-methyltransferase domain/IclR helix-turn-helix domain
MTELSASPAGPVDEMRMMLAGHVIAQSLHVLALLGIPDLIESGHRGLDDLAAATGMHPPSLHRMLTTLASLGVLTETAQGEFGLTPLGATLRSDVKESLRDQALFETSGVVWAAWGSLVDSLRSGQPSFTSVNKSPLFSYLAEHPEVGAVFNRFMTAQSNLQNAAIIQSYDFSGVRTLVDVGGGQGATLGAILGRYPEMRGTLFDLPKVVANTPLIQSPEFAGRCDVIGGSALEGVPKGADIYVLKRVIMSFSDEDSLTILRNCRAAMRTDSRILVIDPMVPDGIKAHYNRLTDLLMLVVPGGRCRPEREFRKLLDAAGVSISRVIDTGSSNFILEGVIA